MASFYTSVEKYFGNIYYVGYEDGRRVVERDKFHPTLFLPTTKKTKYTTLDGRYVDKFKPGTMKECNEFIRTHEADNFKVYGNRDYIAQYIAHRFPNGCTPDPSLVIKRFIDIEVQSDQGFPEPSLAAHKVTAITIKDNYDDIFYVFGLGDFDISKASVKNKRIVYTKCKDEVELLTKFLDRWSNPYPDIITGWNSTLFDIQYLVNRIIRLLGVEYAKKLSMFNIELVKRDDGSYVIPGSTQLDYLDLFKKFGYTYGNQESYKLDNIGNVVLGEKKIDYSEYGSLYELYINNHQKFIDYNIKDTELVERIDDKLNLVSLAMTLAHKAGSAYSTVFGSVKIWDTFIFNVLRAKNVVVSPPPPPSAHPPIEGAYVKDPQIGMHNWVMSFDLNSLYPHLIMMYNMSPETIVSEIYPDVTVDKLLDRMDLDLSPNRCVCATGQLFRTDRYGFFPMIVNDLYNERTIIKKKALDAKQQLEKTNKSAKQERFDIEKQIARFDNEQLAVKIMMNSLYGAMSNAYFRYFDNRIAEGITISGQLAIRTAERAVNAYLNKVLKTDEDYVIAIDTDSIYVRFEKLVEAALPGVTDHDKICSFLDKVAKQKIEGVIAAAYEDLADYVNAYEQKMVMKREIIATKTIFTGKKRYIANVLDSEGVKYAKPKIKITGIESVRSSTPQVCRNMIEDTIFAIVNEDEETVQNLIANLRTEFKKLPPEDVAFPRGVSDIDKTYTTGVPIHVRAARVFNDSIKAGNLTKKYPQIKNGDKIKFTYLKVPNTLKSNVIAFPVILPREFNITRYIDYDTQFEKAYLSPIEKIMTAIGWTTEKVNTLEGFFS